MSVFKFPIDPLFLQVIHGYMCVVFHDRDCDRKQDLCSVKVFDGGSSTLNCTHQHKKTFPSIRYSFSELLFSY
jgi:hypothetical protein